LSKNGQTPGKKKLAPGPASFPTVQQASHQIAIRPSGPQACKQAARKPWPSQPAYQQANQPANSWKIRRSTNCKKYIAKDGYFFTDPGKTFNRTVPYIYIYIYIYQRGSLWRLRLRNHNFNENVRDCVIYFALVRLARLDG
jgi:hypothetical protein